MGRQARDRDPEGKRHSDEDDEDLITLGETDDLRSADDGVEHDESAREPDRERQIPAEERRENNRRGVNRDPARDAALDEEQKPAEQPRFFVEALPEIFVGGENFQALINRDKDRADHDERERLSKIILDEPDAAFISLAGHGKKRERAGLSREHGKADRSPANRPIAFKIFAKVRVIVSAPKSVKRDRDDRREENEVIEPVHENRSVKAKSKATSTAKITTANAYALRQDEKNGGCSCRLITSPPAATPCSRRGDRRREHRPA